MFSTYRDLPEDERPTSGGTRALALMPGTQLTGGAFRRQALNRPGRSCSGQSPLWHSAFECSKQCKG